MSQLGLILTAGNSLRLPLLWFITLFELFWGVALLKLPGIHRTAGWLLLAGSTATLLYFALSMTGPILIAEMFHHVLVLFLILGVFMIGLILRRAAIAQ